MITAMFASFACGAVCGAVSFAVYIIRRLRREQFTTRVEAQSDE